MSRVGAMCLGLVVVLMALNAIVFPVNALSDEEIHRICANYAASDIAESFVYGGVIGTFVGSGFGMEGAVVGAGAGSLTGGAVGLFRGLSEYSECYSCYKQGGYWKHHTLPEGLKIVFSKRGFYGYYSFPPTGECIWEK